MEKNFDYYKQQEASIKARIAKVDERLAWHKAEAEKIKGMWSDEDLHRLRHWNTLHDLKDRFEQKLWDNYSNYQTYCFEKHGFSVIEIA